MSALPQAKYLKDYQPADFTIEDIKLTFELEPTHTRVTAISKVKRCNKAALDFILDGVELNLIEIEIDNQLFTEFSQKDELLIIHHDADEYELKIITEINPLENTSLEGLYLSGGAYCTQCEAEGFRKITFFPDRPDVLATYEVKVIADQTVPYLLSNGNKIASGTLENGKHFAVWQDPYKKPCYLFALVAGQFDVLTDSYVTSSGREVKLELFVDVGNLNKSSHAMASLKKAMQWDEEVYGLEYDLDIYMIVAVDFFNMGAMENKGLNIFNSKCVLANQETATDKDYHMIESIIGHEYFHNWTGNRVTCRDWFQLSLKEGLTVFRDQEFSSDLGSRGINRVAAVKVMRTHQFAEDSGPMAHPIRPEKVIEMNNFYTVTVYDKGAEVIRMIHTLLGKDNFRQGIDLYFARHDGQAVTCDDFVSAMSDASGINLEQFKRWYSQSGTPNLVVKEEYDSLNQRYHLTINQNHPATADEQEKLNLHIPFAIELLDENGDLLALQHQGRPISSVLNLTEASHTFIFDSIKSAPTPVLLVDFSAPCTLDFQYNDQQLINIVRHATSDFSRWDALQSLFIKHIKHAINSDDTQEQSLSGEILQLLKWIVNHPQLDKQLISELLKLPSFDTIASQFTVIPVDQIITVVQAFEQQISIALQADFISLYRQQNDGGQLTALAVGQRAFKGMCIYYLAKTATDEIDKILQAQCDSDNMTDVLAALTALVLANHSLATAMLAQFELKWQRDTLVMDKWLALNAMLNAPNVVEHIKQLYQHPHFDIANPNRVRALVSSFAQFNSQYFHAVDGSGYQLLADLLIQLNKINPQNASRMITPLMSWKKLDTTRQKLVKKQLDRLQQLENLSPDLFEKVTNALK